MRLGVVLTGAGVHAAAGAGLLMELWRRQMEPYAVCGLHTGAWPAALFASGADEQRFGEALSQAAGLGKRLVRKRAFPAATPGKNRAAVAGNAALQRLLTAQTGGRILALCPRKAIIPLKSARTSQSIVFASGAFAHKPDGLVTMQASAAFAARAAMGLSPFLEPVLFMGAPLLPVSDASYAARLLLDMGAQRVLIAQCVPSPRSTPDTLDLAAMCCASGEEERLGGVVRLRIVMPDGVGAMAFHQAQRCAQIGQKTAERELDRLFETMGMAFCRILPFPRRSLI